MAANKRNNILDFLKRNPRSSSKEIFDGIDSNLSYATVKRILTQLLNENLVLIEGSGKASKYSCSPHFHLFYPIEVNQYFEKEIDERVIINSFNLDLISGILKEIALLKPSEIIKLDALQAQFQANILQLSAKEYEKEMERLAIDLSWKSSQIEGNTYSLLETERLLKEKETATGKTKDDAVMLLNHKAAIDFIVEQKNYLSPLTIMRIEDIHSILMQELGVERNIRVRKVGITGTNYSPLDNEFQIKEALNQMCELINSKSSVFEKSLLALLLLSYIQPFVDGNKRTARIISNAILIENVYCPISFRTVDTLDYKKAMLIFYEQNNFQPMKEIFIGQFEFAVKTYF
jgi:Fic family protein/predicted transcriptional regulator